MTAGVRIPCHYLFTGHQLVSFPVSSCKWVDCHQGSSGGIAVLRVAWACLSVYEGTDVFYLFHKCLVGLAFSEVTTSWEEPSLDFVRGQHSQGIYLCCLVPCLFHLAFKIDWQPIVHATLCLECLDSRRVHCSNLGSAPTFIGIQAFPVPAPEVTGGVRWHVENFELKGWRLLQGGLS